MPRTIGKATSGLWFLLGALCMAVFGGRAAQAQATAPYWTPPPPYGIPPPPQQETDIEETKAANALVEKYLGPVEAQTPTAEQQTQIAEALKGLTADDKAARDAAVKTLVSMGPAALGALREAAAKDDATPAEVVAVYQIESAERVRLANELKAKGQPGVQAAVKKCVETQSAFAAAQAALKKAKEDVNPLRNDPAADAALAQTRDAVAKAKVRAHLAQQLLLTVRPPSPPPNPGAIEAKYGVRPKLPDLTPAPPNPGPVAKYGIRANPPQP